MKVLVACEFSGVVRRAFRDAGHDAYSCDLLPAEDGDKHHLQADILKVLSAKVEPWDLMIAHPPCTFLTCAGARWFNDPRYPDRRKDQEKAVIFFLCLLGSGIKHIAVENPRPLRQLTEKAGKFDQQVQPWQFGDKQTKGVCLWLRNLPKLKPTKNVYAETMALPPKERHRVWYMPPGPNRQMERSRFFPGVAKAMAEQWGGAC